MKTLLQRTTWSILLLCFLFTECSKAPDTSVTPKSSAKTLTNPNIDGVSGTSSVFDALNSSYTITVPAGTNVTALKLNFNLPSNTTAEPTSGSVQNFTNPVTYTVTAEDGTTQMYVVKVVVASVSTPVNLGNSCLLTRIDIVGTRQYLEFKYDSQNRMTEINGGLYYTYNSDNEPNASLYAYKVKFVYDGEKGDLIEASALQDGSTTYYKFIYQNGKLVRCSYVWSGNSSVFVHLVDVNGSNQIIKETDRNKNCTGYQYVDGAITRFTDCYGGTVSKPVVEYKSNTKHFLINHLNRPGFMYGFKMVQDRNFGFMPFYFGKKMPTTFSYYNGTEVIARNLFSYTQNSYNFPTEVSVIEETRSNTDFPIKKTKQYKLTYSNCQ